MFVSVSMLPALPYLIWDQAGVKCVYSAGGVVGCQNMKEGAEDRPGQREVVLWRNRRSPGVEVLGRRHEQSHCLELPRALVPTAAVSTDPLDDWPQPVAVLSVRGGRLDLLRNCDTPPGNP